MTANEILKLIDAGFTKEDILKLDADALVVPTETPAPKNPADDKPAEIPEVKAEPVVGAPKNQKKK